MKKLFFAGLLPVFLFICSCKDEPDHNHSFQEYRQYVMSHRDKAGNFVDKSWAELEKEYSLKKSIAESQNNKWSDSMKTEFFKLQSVWESFRVDFESEKERRGNLVRASRKVTTILPGNIDESLSNVDTTNIVGVYRHLVSYIDEEGNDFSPQQWDQIENLWDRLAKRYDQLENKLSGAERAAISEQVIRFGVIRAINKPVARMQDST